jgi:hypothetical protein
MLKKIIAGLVIVTFFVSGCGQGKSSVKVGGGDKGNSTRIDTPAGMIEYLESRRLPALKSVKVWQNEYGPGLKLTTEHYEILTTLLEPLMLSEVPGFMESAYRGYNDQLPEPIETVTKFKVYLFAERGQWEKFTRDFTGPQSVMYLKIKAGAYYLNDACVAYNIGRERTFAVLGHEGWHQFNKKHFQFRLPSWLDEGVAMLFETGKNEGGLFYFEPAKNMYQLGSLKKTLMDNKMIPLRQLIAMDPGEAVLGGDAAVTAFYGQSYALVRFLREENYGKRLGQYHQLMMDGLKGRWPLDEMGRRIATDRNIPMTTGWNSEVGSMLFTHYIGSDIGKLEDEYVAFCRKIVYHVYFK